jgi:PhzF family phenazine biosynthesis protein
LKIGPVLVRKPRNIFRERVWKNLAGNSLPVFLNAGGLEAAQMLKITQELRHFEAIFLTPSERQNRVQARVFDLFEELPFAGHPIIGAAAAMHQAAGATHKQTWQIDLRDKVVSITTERTAEGYFGLLDQGAAELLGEVTDRETFARAFNLTVEDLDPSLPLSVISTGLRYLIVPVLPSAIGKARIERDIAHLMRDVNAQFAVLLDDQSIEARHWNNDGVIEDIATGSAAGAIGAYRLRHGRAKPGETFILHQGRFTGRASQLRVQLDGSASNITSVKVGGDVAIVGTGVLDVLP